MALAPSAATALPPELEPVPLLLPWDLRLTPEQFERVCQANPEAVLELSNIRQSRCRLQKARS